MMSVRQLSTVGITARPHVYEPQGDVGVISIPVCDACHVVRSPVGNTPWRARARQQEKTGHDRISPGIDR